MSRFHHTLQGVALAVLLLATSLLHAGNVLFKDGKSSYSIVISTQASTSEQTAARELQQYIEQISGARLPITSDLDAPGRHIYVGFNQKVAQLTGETARPADYEGYTYRTVGKDILIYGGSKRGTMYGVFSFLEDQLGVLWLTPEYTKVPQLKQWHFQQLSHSEQPAIKYRFSDYYQSVNALPTAAHLKENMKWSPADNEYGGVESYWGCHTMGQLIPAKEFFGSHPEYYSLHGGKRIPDGQLCLSNPEVLELCKVRLAKAMREYPDSRIYSLSQNDNQKYCECSECKAIEDRFGSHSGLMVWFVNQVADAVKDEFPGKFVGTFAYQYTRKPPVGIVPCNNVVIRLCSIECCFAHPLSADCPENRAFMDDIRTWGTIAPHLFIWDYIIDFSRYFFPWPNIQVLGPNIEVFQKHHAIGVFEEAEHESVCGEFSEMKAWVVKKLLWNPHQDADALVKTFIDNYYGKAAPMIHEYYRLCQQQVKPDVHYGIYIEEQHEVYHDQFVRQAFSILDEATQAAEDDEIRQRVERVRMQPLDLYCMRHREQALADGSWEELASLMAKYKSPHQESRKLKDFIRLQGLDQLPEGRPAMPPRQATGTGTSKYQYVGSYSNGLAKAKRKGRYGYISSTGAETVPCRYRQIDSFFEGLAAAQLSSRWGYVTAEGQVAIPFGYEEADRFSEGLARVKMNGKWGYINPSGEAVIPCTYDGAVSFSGGLARVKQDGKWGIIDTQGKAVLPCQYDEIHPYAEGLALVVASGKYGFADTQGNIIIPLQYNKAGSFSEGLAKVKLQTRWGYINPAGRLMIPHQFDNCDSFHNGITEVKIQGRWGYFINAKGEMLSTP